MSERFVIWSNEHRAWWRPASMGYTPELEAAGRYTLTDAIKICNGGNIAWKQGENPHELPIMESVARELVAAGTWPREVA